MSTVPNSARFSTADRLNTPEAEQSKEDVLAEALKIVRGETMMLAQKKHLVALAELNGELLKILKEALDQTGCDGDLCFYSWHEAARRVIAETEGGA